MLSKILALVFSFCVYLYTPLSQAIDNNITGIWVTKTAIPYLVEHTKEHPFGAPVTHDKHKLLKRLLTLKWQLKQDKDGLITGTNQWISYDENNQKVIEGSESFIGAYQQGHIILTEFADNSAHVTFDMNLQENQLIGIAYNFTGPKMIAFPFTLIRDTPHKNNP
ncbi:hypothetical protein [uncultured Shewanella sp.]|uniref:hypothetical protein n=1 Tax=uncultured Shewanella sp. TaxID=173975 RepID=UPI002623B55E|nr:hypothetical protein [uncultured Shewanella sp.]